MLVTGSGFLKGNISGQVGAIDAREDEARRPRGFFILSTGINIGAVTGPMVCGLLAQVYGWHYGFGIAALFMLVGLATYLYGYRHLPARVAQSHHAGSELTAADWRTVWALIAVLAITIFQSITVNQIFNVMPIWIQEHVALEVGGFRVPIPWYQSLYSVASILSVPLLFWLWRRQSLRGGEPDELAKIGTGAWIAVVSNLVLVAASLASGGARMHPLWAILYIAGSGLSFLYYWPTLLALVSRAAPARANATLMGLAFMSLFIANILIGWIGSYYERMRPADFWALHAAIAAAGGLLVLVFGRRLSRALH